MVDATGMDYVEKYVVDGDGCATDYVDRAFTAGLQCRRGLKRRGRSELARTLCLYDAFTGHGMAWREWQTDPKGFFASINVYSSSSRPEIEAAATASIGPKMPRVCFVFFKLHEPLIKMKFCPNIS